MKNGFRILGITCFIVLFLCFLTIWNFAAYNDLFNNIIVLLSIFTGFNVTSLSIVANSSFSAKLHEIEDKENKEKTLLHKLVREFQLATIIYLLTIATALMYLFLIGSDKLSHQWVKHAFIKAGYLVNVPDVVKALTLCLTVYCFVLFFKLMQIFAGFVIQSSKYGK